MKQLIKKRPNRDLENTIAIGYDKIRFMYFYWKKSCK